MERGVRQALGGNASIESFDSGELLARNLSTVVARQLRRGIDERGQVTLAVSGGNTPKCFFHQLSHQQLPWERVTVTVVDERWVAADHSDSNARLVAEHLLQHRARAAAFVSLKTDHDTPREAVGEVEMRLAQLVMPFDAVILGMGLDGHTASFSPGAAALREALDRDSGRLCVAVEPPVAAHRRMTLSLPAILNTRFLALHIEGADKLQILQRALGQMSEQLLPVSAVLKQTQVPVHTFYAGDCQ